jgi:hypothetical protein
VIQAFDDGAAWHEYYGSIPIFATNGFPSTWVNQGGSTIDTTKGGVIFHAPAGSGDNFRELVKSTPSTPYVITIGALFLHNVGTHEVGVGWRDSASGKMSVVAFFGTNLFLLHYTNPTTWSASVFSLTISFPFGAAIWFRLSDDGTNRKLSMSVDGINFQVMPGFTETRTTFLTADQIGFMVNVADGTYPVDAWYFSWDEA